MKSCTTLSASGHTYTPGEIKSVVIQQLHVMYDIVNNFATQTCFLEFWRV